MKLGGWDTFSALSIDLANQALEAGQDQLLTTFDHNRDGVRIKGTFGPWRILPGPGIQSLRMEIFIREGRARGLSRLRTVDLAGMSLEVELPLGVVPSPDGKAPAELKFDLAQDGLPPEEIVIPFGLNGPKGRLDDLASEILQLALCDCLSKNADKIGFVFARIAPGGQSGSSMYTPHLGWASLPMGDGRQYLAIFGAKQPPTASMGTDKVDPELIGAAGSAVFACSFPLYAERVLTPWLTANFKPKAKFAAKGGAVHLTSKPKLPKVKTPIGHLQPVLSKMQLTPGGGGLRVTLTSLTPLKLGTTLIVDMDFVMKLTVDAKGKIGLKPDRKPKVRHRIDGKGFIGAIVSVIVELVLNATGTDIDRIAAGLAAKFQNLNTPDAQPVVWTGARRFVTKKVQCQQCLWFADTRAA